MLLRPNLNMTMTKSRSFSPAQAARDSISNNQKQMCRTMNRLRQSSRLKWCCASQLWVAVASLSLILGFLATPTHAQCDDSKGCYPPVFDVLEDIDTFPDRSYAVSGTCGLDPPASVTYNSLLGYITDPQICDSILNTADKMLDNGDSAATTFWQSPLMVESTGSDPTPQYVEFRFTDEFIFYEIFITFYVPGLEDQGDSIDVRPKKMIIEKLDSNGNWTALIYMATDCATAYPDLPIVNLRSTSVDYSIVACRNHEHAGDDPFLNLDNEVSYSPGFLYDVSYDLLKNDPGAIAHFTTSGIRLYFEEPANSQEPTKSYIMISDVIVDVFCSCSGHASECTGPNQATCQCSHNTTGEHCDSCLPLFNDQPWEIGTSTDANACQECDCNDLADSCIYDAAKDYGVCQNCSSNTAGDKCETCIEGFYINPLHVNDSSVDYCLPCSCSSLGTLASALNTCDVNTGQCTCKDRVEGRDCSVCKDTFWGLTADNDLGCQECSCNAAGSLGSINLCDKTDGQCLCKTNVEGSACDTCKPATYNFDAGNPDGCTLCECDPGASLSENCDLTTGQCDCRSNIGSRNCSTPDPGYFVPKLDLMVLEPEEFTAENVVLRSGSGTVGATVSGRGFVSLSSANQIAITFTSGFSGPMNIIARYEIPTADTVVVLQGSLSLASAEGYTCAGVTYPAGQTWTLLHSNIPLTLNGGVSLGTVCLEEDAIYTISLDNPSNTFLVDSVVIMPTTTAIEGVLEGRLDSNDLDLCVQKAINEVPANRADCTDVEYSAVAAFINGTKECQCTTGAVTSTVCDAKSGDCPCRANVLGPDCSQCEVDAYSFSLASGCIDCDCHLTGSTSDVCTAEGECSCLTNVEGRKCDACAAEHYGLATGEGCVPCECDPTYSVNNNCDDLGVCLCKTGLAGPLCTACLDGFYNLTPDGCTECACNPQGSTESSCDSVSGVCQCLDNVEGDTCSTCKAGYFGLGAWHPGGCIPCFCWGYGDECSSAQGYYSATTEQTWLASDPNALSEVWTAVDSAGSNASVVETTLIGDRYGIGISEASRSELDIFLLADSTFLGNRASAYGRDMTVTMSPSATASATSSSSEDIGYDVILSDGFCSLGYRWNSSVVEANVETTVTIPFTETSWTVVGCGIADENGTIIVVDGIVLLDPGDVPDYPRFVAVVAQLTELRIRVYTGNQSDSALDLLGVTLEGAVDGSVTTAHSGVLVNNVETCECNVGYTGSSCEACGKDHTRSTPGMNDPSISCVACSCNNHGVTECTAEQLVAYPGGDTVACAADLTSCDPVSGVCICTHFTGGDHCEVCLQGYYGDATRGTENDCLPCGCPGIIVNGDINVFSNSCSANEAGDPVCVNCTEGHGGDRCEFCVDGYFGTPENATNNGGQCSPCDCNGRADTCDTTTGVCIDCRNDTAGDNCEICAPGFFGDAMNGVCEACVCVNYIGSTGNCDHVTGECECLPNVGGAQCDVCDDMTFNLTAEIGCEPCNCSEDGSTSLVCDKIDGQCPCLNLVEGRTCSECQAGYWNVNQQTGCDPCLCNATGTATLEDGSIDPTCDVITGQCTCALPGITGRTCDSCLPVTANTYTYINLFYIGLFPECVLCGECFDSWADKIEVEGVNIATANTTIRDIWTHYDSQTGEEVSAALDAIEQKIVEAAQSISAVEDIAQQLQDAEERFAEAMVKLAAISGDVTSLSGTQTSLQQTLTSLQALTEVVEISVEVSTSVTDLGNELDDLIRQAEALSLQGNSSWATIERLSFVVASPEDRERQLQQQADDLLAISDAANQNYETAANLYSTALDPGVEDKAQELDVYSDGIAGVQATVQDVTVIINGVLADITATSATAETLVTEAAAVKTALLKAVDDLQAFTTNTSAAQLSAQSVLENAIAFKELSERALETIINSTNAVLGNLASLSQAQTDLTLAQPQADTVLGITLPTVQEIDGVISLINQAEVSAQAVEDLNLRADMDLFTAEQAVEDSQTALAKARELNQDLIIMEEDIQESRDLRALTETVSNASDAMYADITNTIQEAAAHSDKAEQDASDITADVIGVAANVTAAIGCLDQAEVDVSSAVTSAEQMTSRAQTATDAQVTLLDLMAEIGEAANDAGVGDVVLSMTQANSTLTDMENGLAELEALVDIAGLIQILQTQESQLTSLNAELDSMTSEVDTILVSLQEAEGEADCEDE